MTYGSLVTAGKGKNKEYDSVLMPSKNGHMNTCNEIVNERTYLVGKLTNAMKISAIAI